MDVINVQDSGGSGYSASGGPMSPSQLQADLKAAAGQVSSYSGFSFTTQMDPDLIGTSSYYNAYRAYQ